MGPRITHAVRGARPRAVATLVLLAAAIAVAACSGTASAPPTYPPGSIIVTAHDRTFDTKEIRLPADTEATLVLVNRDSDPHNIEIRTKQGFDGDLKFRFDPVALQTVVLTLPPLPAGTYYFLCAVHPSMTGTVFVY